MTRIVLLFLTCSLLWACGSSPKKEEKACCEKEVIDTTDIENNSLKKWASFFSNFSDSLNNFEATKRNMHFPFIAYGDSIKSDNFSKEDLNNLIPEDFIAACQRANLELKTELSKFENHKLFKSTDSDYYKLLIDYKEGYVIVTHIERKPKSKKMYHLTKYTFKTVGRTRKHALKNWPFKLESIGH